jgi:predicted RNA-binding Zn ribbon-like protein
MSTPVTSIDTLLVVANTRHGPGAHFRVRVTAIGPDHDHLADPADARAYIVDHDIEAPASLPDRRTLEALAAIREIVRALARDRDAAGRPASTPTNADVEAVLRDRLFTLAPDGSLRPARHGWPGFVAGLLPPLLELRADPSRLRVCGNPRCRFAFIDRSRNVSRVWCDPHVCGNRVRVGRARGRAEPAAIA